MAVVGAGGPPMKQTTRIGLLVDSLMSRYQVRLFNGVRRVAHRLGARVTGFQGNYLTSEETVRPVFDGSFLYELAGPECVDGLIVVTNVLTTGVGPDAVAAFCRKSGVCAVSIGELPGFPHIDIDNSRGVGRVVEHLIDVHGRGRLAFICGPRANGDSIERERVFRSTLQARGLPVVEDWILPGNFLEVSGATAIRTLYDERRVGIGDVDAIVAANDQMASGAVHALVQRGVRVPRDLSVVGFDDDDHARNNHPPLTTVSQPIERIAERAVELLWERMAGRPVPERTLMAADAVIRRSCGCGPATLLRQSRGEPGEPLAGALGRRRVACLETLEHLGATPAEASGVDALIEYVSAQSEPDAERARDAFEQSLTQTSGLGIDPVRWQDALGPIHDAIEQYADSDGAGWTRARRRLLTAQLQISEVTARTRMLGQLHNLQLANAERVLGSALACARNFQALARVLEAGLGGVGVRYSCVCTFVPGDPGLAEVIALYDPIAPPVTDLLQNAEQLWRALPPSLPPSQSPPRRSSAAFPARELLSPRSRPTINDVDLLVYPLVFAKDALGYVVFDAPGDIQRAWVLEGLAGHLSSAVYALERAQELLRARESAETASAAKSEFVAVMSHEVRTPLTAILGHLDLCLTTSLTREQRAHLSRARGAAETLLGIVSDILDFSKIEAKKLSLEAVPFELDEVLDQVIGTCAIAAARKGVEFVVDVAPGVPQRLTGDPLRLTQVLLNLVGNAVKFSQKGHVLLRIEVVSTEYTGLRLRFTIADSGIGMSAEQLEVVFDPFTQADGSMTRRYGGTGLGLTISKRLVALMGGELRVESELAGGSEFSFECGFAERDGFVPATNEPLSIRVLVVEDSEHSARALTRALEARGCSVTAVSSGASALEIGARERFELVLMDHALPDADGLELAGRLRAASSGSPSVVLLGPAHVDVPPEDLRRSGVDALLPKPFHSTALFRAIARARRRMASSRPPDALAAAPGALEELSILVVQDDEASRDVTESILKMEGADVRVVGNGVEAIDVTSEIRFDLVLMDVHLPLLDGCAAARAILGRERGANTPIVALSASSSQEDRARCLAAGMKAYVCTPIDKQVLIRTLLDCLEAAEPPRQTRPSIVALDGTAELDAATAIARLGGDAALYRRLLDRFLATHQSSHAEITLALAKGDSARAALVSHTLSGSAANVGAERLHRAARAVETALGPRASSPPADELMEELGRAAEAAFRAIGPAEGSPRSSASWRPASGAVEDALRALQGFLYDHDTAAVDVVETLRTLLEFRLSARDSLHRLEASVAAYDFDRAREDLELLKSALVPRDSELIVTD
jgi:signal transduction histidine kinase/CheY-like chemotaxis protein/DNA-binding LacI/PurR family transcriptional regulator